MATGQSANQLKTPAMVSWAFKMVSQFGSLSYTIMEKTAGLTVVQKTIIDTLHKEGKPQTFIAKEAGCSQSAVSKHVNRKLSGRKKCGRKRCTTNRENRSLVRIVKQMRFKNLGELHKEWTEAGVKASRATTHRRVNEFGFSCPQRRLTWAKEKKNWTVTQWSKVLFSDESKFCISFGNQGPRVWRKGGEAHSPSYLKSSVKFPQSVMIWGVMPSAGVGPLCFLKTNVTAPVYQEILEHFMLPSADQLFKDADFIFQQDLAPAHTAKSTNGCINEHICWCAWLASKLPRPEPHTVSIGIVKSKMRNKRPKKNADELKATVKEKINILSRRPTIHKKIHFIGLMKYSNLLRWWIGGVLLNVSQNHHNKKNQRLFYIFNTRVSQFELNYCSKWTFPRHSNLLRCTCILCKQNIYFECD